MSTPNETIAALGANREKAALEESYRTRAKLQYGREGEIEIDSNAIVSIGDDNGAYVAAWVWVADEGSGNEDEADEGDDEGDDDDDIETMAGDLCDTCGESGKEIARTAGGKTVCIDCDSRPRRVTALRGRDQNTRKS